MEAKNIVKRNIDLRLENLYSDFINKKSNVEEKSLESFLRTYDELNKLIFDNIKGNISINQIIKKLEMAKKFI